MEERYLFDRIHDALDIEPPAGSYERLRLALNKKPVNPRLWPALPMRWSNMSVRVAAGIALVALAAATAAAIIAVHNASTNNSPAGSRMSIAAYQQMISRDWVDPNVVWSNPCDETVHTGCMADATRSIPMLQKWLDDLDKSTPPTRFAMVDAEMRQHLAQSIAALNALNADARAKDDAAMTRDFIVAVYGAEWTSTVVPAIPQSQEVSSAIYIELVRSEAATLDACGAACGLTETAASCVNSSGIRCVDYHDTLAYHLASYQADVIRKAPPSSLSARAEALQRDFAQADAVLITMRVAVAAKDQSGFNSGIARLKPILTQLDRDAAAMNQG
jgi:hypothetical protein